MVKAKDYNKLTIDEIITEEKKKLAGIYTRMDAKTKKATQSLIDEAAFMGASLWELRRIIKEKGYTEEYQNGANQKGTKKCSEVEVYNAMIKNYMGTIKQLTDLIPKQVQTPGNLPGDGFEDFVNDRED